MTPTPELLTAPNLHARHGFSTRRGGSSTGPYGSLNLRHGLGDEHDAVERNIDLFLEAFGSSRDRLCVLKQVHGGRAVEARPGESQEADAHVSIDPDLLLVVGWADCLPLLLSDPDSGAVGAVHSGWRSTVAGIAGETLRLMNELYGTQPERVRVALGPGICGDCYEVGDEVAQAVTAAGAEIALRAGSRPGKWQLDIPRATLHLLEKAGVDPDNVCYPGWCTSCEPGRFYSHRRDRGLTGRQWAGIRAQD